MAALYHLVPPEMRGETLWPLNRLREIDADLYATHVRKYRGREGLLSKPVPELGCLWLDCLFFSPVHPEAIRDAFRARDLPWRTDRAVFAFDTDRLPFDAENTLIWRFEDVRPKTDFTLPERDVAPFDSSALADLTSLPDRTGDYLDEVVAQDLRPLLFVGVPHILHRGAVSVAQATILRV